jgi:hypothetical protein
MSTVEQINFDTLCQRTDIRECGYCRIKLNFPCVAITDANKVEVFLHRNCVVAFATRILNEFEKL